MAAPLCRCCGKKLVKRIDLIHFGRAPLERERYPASHRIERPANRAEAQRLVNQQIVRTRWGKLAHHDADPMVMFGQEVRATSATLVERYVVEVGVWDGESYRNFYGHFCTISCAAAFGRLAAEVTDLQTQRYADAQKASTSAK